MPVISEYKGKKALVDEYQQHVVDTWIIPLVEFDTLQITRGHSLPIDQLQVIAGFVNANGIVFPEFNAHDVYERKQIDYEGHQLVAYQWWRTWGALLNKGILINPPLAAVAPFDYIRYGVNKKGQLIPASPHIKEMPTIEEIARKSFTPCPLDWSQYINRDTPRQRIDIDYVADVMEQAKLNGAPIRAITVEHKNGCVHTDLELV